MLVLHLRACLVGKLHPDSLFQDRLRIEKRCTDLSGNICLLHRLSRDDRSGILPPEEDRLQERDYDRPMDNGLRRASFLASRPDQNLWHVPARLVHHRDGTRHPAVGGESFRDNHRPLRKRGQENQCDGNMQQVRRHHRPSCLRGACDPPAGQGGNGLGRGRIA